MRTFFSWISERRSVVLYLLIIGIGCMVYFILQKLHYREGVSNLEIYHGVGKAALAHNPLYGVAFDGGVGYFDSAPIIAYVFSPLSFTNYAVANSIYYFIILTIFIFLTPYLIYRLERDFNLTPINRGWVLILTSLFLVDHLERELHLGNFNIFLLVISFIIYRLLSLKKVWLAAMLMAMILLMKPSLVVLLPVFLILKSPRFYVYATVFFLIGISLPFSFLPYQEASNQLSQWWGIWTSNIDFYLSPNTIYGIYNHWILNPFGYESGLAIVPALLLLLTYGIVRWYRLIDKTDSPLSHISVFAVSLAIVPNLILADTEHFMWSWLLLVLLFIVLQHRKDKGERVLMQGVVLGLAFIPYVLNSPDIVGRTMMLVFDEGGWLGFANLLIIATFMWLMLKELPRILIQPKKEV